MAQQLIINLHTNIENENGQRLDTQFNYKTLATDPPTTIARTQTQTPYLTNLVDIASIPKLSNYSNFLNFLFNISYFKKVLKENRPYGNVLTKKEKAFFIEQNIMTILENLFPPPITTSWMSLTKTSSTVPIQKNSTLNTPKQMSYFRINNQDYTLIETKWKNDITNDQDIMKYIMKIYDYMNKTLKQNNAKELTYSENRMITYIKSSNFMKISKSREKNAETKKTRLKINVDMESLVKQMKKVLNGILNMIRIVNDYNEKRNYYSSRPFKNDPLNNIERILLRFFTNSSNIITKEEKNSTYTGRLIKQHIIEPKNIESLKKNLDDSINAQTQKQTINNSFSEITQNIITPEYKPYEPKNIIELFKRIGETPDTDKSRKKIFVKVFSAAFEDLNFLDKESDDFNFFRSNVSVLTDLYAMVKQIKNENQFAEDNIKNMVILNTQEEGQLEKAPKEYREFVNEIIAITNNLKLYNEDLQKIMREYATGNATESIMIPFIGYLIKNGYLRDNGNIVEAIENGDGAVFDDSIFESDNSNIDNLFEKCIKSGFKMDANGNVIIDVDVDFLIGRIASKDIPVCKLRNELLGNHMFKIEKTGNKEDDFLEERLDPYLLKNAEDDTATKNANVAPAYRNVKGGGGGRRGSKRMRHCRHTTNQSDRSRQKRQTRKMNCYVE